ncbi:MAG: hypothetical protein K8T26_01510 [Lentisphaerae bacterium]|nr:hypothetical protein [Lentisphaerota bacterium]
MYDDKHRFMQMGSIKPGIKYHQKGLREHLLCQPCETHLSISENYVSEFLGSMGGYEVERKEQLSLLAGLDYKHIRIFFLSVLWRMSVSSLPMFKNVSLGVHEEVMRQMLAADDPGLPQDYGFLAVIPYIDGEFCKDWLLQPDWIRFQNRRLYRAVIGGILYLFVASRRPPVMPHPSVFIQRSGEWIIQHQDVRQIPHLKQWLDEASLLNR